MKYKNWQEKIAVLSLNVSIEDKEESGEYFVKVQSELQDFCVLLQESDLGILKKYSNDNYNAVCQNISKLEKFFEQDNIIDKEELRELHYLATTGYRFLAAAKREALPFLLLAFQNEEKKEEEKIVAKTDIIECMNQQILHLVDDFEKYDVSKLELYAPELWKKIRNDLDIIENIVDDVNELDTINATIAKLLKNLDVANSVSKKQEEKTSTHLDSTTVKLDKLITTIASLKFPTLLTYKIKECENLFVDLEKVNDCFFHNESSAALDYRAANARMDDCLNFISLSIPTLEEEISKQQESSLLTKTKLQSELDQDKKNCKTAIQFLAKKRFLAFLGCIPFVLLVTFFLSASSLFEDICFAINSYSIEKISSFYGLSMTQVLLCCIILSAFVIGLFLILKRLSLESYSVKKIKKYSIFKEYSKKNNVTFFSAILLVVFFISSVAILSLFKIKNVTLANIKNFSERDFDYIINQIDVLKTYKQHPKEEIQIATFEALFSILKKYKKHPSIKKYRADYQQELITKEKWYKLSQILQPSKFAEIFSKNINIETLASNKDLFGFNNDVLQYLVEKKPVKIARLALKNLTKTKEKRSNYWKMLFSFHHEKGKKQHRAIRYFFMKGKNSWLEKMLQLVKENKDIKTQKLLINELAKLAKRHKGKAKTIATNLMTISNSQKGIQVEITTYGIAKIMHPVSLEYLRHKLLIVKLQQVQIAIIHALAKIKDKKIADDVIMILCESPHYKVRKEAVNTLNIFHPKFFQIWKIIAKIKSSSTRKKAIIKYTNKYKMIVCQKYLMTLIKDKTTARTAKKTIRELLKYQRKHAKIALMHLFTNRELSVAEILKKQGYENLKLVHNLERIPNADLVIATENGTLSKERISQLIFQGKKVLLLYNAGEILGGKWGKGATLNHRKISTKPGFLGTFEKQFLMQSQKNAYFVNKPYPDNWKSHIGNDMGFTILQQKNKNQTQGIIFTYDPDYFTKQGNQMFALIIDFLLRINRF